MRRLFILFIPLIFTPLFFCILSDILTPASVHAEVVTAIGSGGYALTVSGAGTVDLGLTPTAGGSFIMGLETLNIKTNADGYQAYLSTAENTTNLTHVNGSDIIPATPYPYTSGPASIGTNSWGFAVPASYKNSSGTTITNPNLEVSGFGNVDNGFSAESSAVQLEGSTKWASIPEKSDPLLIQKTTTANNTTGVDLGIFYSAKANTSQSAGIYNGEVLYTILAAVPSATEASIAPSAVGNLGGSNTFTVTLGLNTTANDNIKNNSTVTIGDKACTVTGASNNGSGNLVLTCTDSKQDITGRYNVTITVSDGTNNYGTYYISNGVEYRSVISPEIAWMAPSAIYNVETFARTLRIGADILPTNITFDSATVTVGSNTCTNPSIISASDGYIVNCTAPIGLSAGDYPVKISLAKNGDTLVNLNTSITYTATNSLYAVSDMQDMTTAACAATPTPSTTSTIAERLSDITIDSTTGLAEQVPSVSLLDTRDNQRYTVRKLADGNCWMTENLRFGATTNTAADTPNPWASTTDPATNTATTSTGANVLADSTNGLIDTHIITVNSGAKGADGSTAFSDVNEYYQKPYIAIYQANTEDNVSDTGTKFGVLYNYCAATGGTACTANGTTPTVSGSICPTNWYLPAFNAEVGTASGTNASYNNLTATYGIGYNTSTGVSKITSAPLSFPRAGYFSDGSLYDRSASGFGNYWSSSPNGDTSAFRLGFYNTSNITRYNDARRLGRSVRCVLAP